ncbi:MAG: hypothetical protein WCG26_00160 [Chloroflexales bacterium]
MLAALEAAGDARPLEDWLHLAMAEMIAYHGGGRVEEILDRWGFRSPDRPPADEEAWLQWAEKHGQITNV